MPKEKETGLGSKEFAMQIFTFLLIITCIFMVFKSIVVFRDYKYDGQANLNTMTFTGEGEVFAVADVATFDFSVTEEAKTPKEAQELSARKINAAIAYLKEQGIADKDIKTTSYNVYPKYEWRDTGIKCVSVNCPPSGKNVLIGYEASQSVLVKVRDTEKAGEILSGVGTVGISNVSGLDFSIDDQDKLNRDARKMAIENAKQKAGMLAKDLGVDLVKIVNFSETGDYPMPMYKAMDSSRAIGGAEMAQTPNIPLGENRIVSNVTITYEIR